MGRKIIPVSLIIASLLSICAIASYALLKPSANSAKKEEKLSFPPQRIISLGPSITKSLYLLGADSRLIANTIYCTNPADAKKKEKIGTVIKINIEKIFNLKPDLVLATSLTEHKAKERLEDLGLKIVTFPTSNNFNHMCNQFLELGKLVGEEKKAEGIIKEAVDKVDSIKKRVKDLPQPKVLVQVGAKPLFVATGRYFVNDYIEFAGGVNIAKEEEEGIYSREEALKANPDVIIITTMGIVGDEEKKIWERYKTLSAVKNRRIYIIDTDEVTSPTPVSFVKTLEEFVCILHPGEEIE